MNVFEHVSYKAYLKKVLASTGESRGAKSQLAKFLSCQSGFISQVLNGYVHFSFEHSLLVTKYLELGPEESEYFMLLVSQEKAGTKDLKQYYESKLASILEKRSLIKERIQVKERLSKEDKMTYYSQWYYAAIHIAVMIEGLRTKDSLSRRFHLPPTKVQEILDFLENNQLIIQDGKEYLVGKSRIHLEKNSPLIVKHHSNWRMESIKALERTQEDNLHYSSVITLSVSDAKKIKEVILKSLEEIEAVLAPSPEEEIFSLNIDFFRL